MLMCVDAYESDTMWVSFGTVKVRKHFVNKTMNHLIFSRSSFCVHQIWFQNYCKMWGFQYCMWAINSVVLVIWRHFKRSECMIMFVMTSSHIKGRKSEIKIFTLYGQNMTSIWVLIISFNSNTFYFVKSDTWKH